jgi:hypothetical protein
MTDITCCIKTFERPEHLHRLLTSIRRYYPTMPILVADDSRAPTAVTVRGVRVVTLPYDTGLSEGRNELVRQTDTARLLMLDDDYVFTPQTDLTRLAALMDSNSDIDILGGRVQNVPRHEFIFHGMLDESKGRLTLLRKHAMERRPGFDVVEVIPNFFMAITERLKLVKWDTELKLSEHLDFFARARGILKVGICDDVVITHDHGTPSPTYRRMRSRSAQFQRLFEIKRKGHHVVQSRKVRTEHAVPLRNSRR